MFKIFCTYICCIIYKMQHLEISGAVRYIQGVTGGTDQIREGVP